MITRKVETTDFEGKPYTEEFQFHLSKAEIAELDVVYSGGLKRWCEEIAATKDGEKIMETFKRVLRMSVGRKSPDGRKFVKTKEITSDFMDSNAYVEVFTKLVTDAEEAAAFINGLVA